MTLLLPALVALAAVLLLAVAGRFCAALVHPAQAARLLTLSALVAALGCGFVLAAVALTALARVPGVATLGHWSARAAAAGDPLPAPAGGALGILVLALLGRSVLRAVTLGKDLAAAELTCRRLGPGAGGLVVVDADEPDAYTVAGLSGRVVVSTAMLRALPPEERRALLAHEASHLRHRHHVYVQLADLAAAANPLLRGTAAAVHLAVERWADEDAADAIGDRTTTARALARAGLARQAATRAPRAAGALAAVASGVADRAKALLAPAPHSRRGFAAALLTLSLTVLVASAVVERQTEDRFEAAHDAYVQHVH